MRIAREEFVDATIKGIKKSFDEYYKWSGGEWLWNAPEYLLTVNIAKEIYNIEGSKFITLEDNVKYLLENANAEIKGKLSQRVRANGRSDIALWWGKGTVRGIIEVKNQIWSVEDLKEDLDRILETLKKESDIEFGMLAFYLDRHYEKGGASDKLENVVKSIIKKLKDLIEEYDYKYIWAYEEVFSEKNDSAFAVSFMVIK